MGSTQRLGRGRGWRLGYLIYAWAGKRSRVRGRRRQTSKTSSTAIRVDHARAEFQTFLQKAAQGINTNCTKACTCPVLHQRVHADVSSRGFLGPFRTKRFFPASVRGPPSAQQDRRLVAPGMSDAIIETGPALLMQGTEKTNGAVLQPPGSVSRKASSSSSACSNDIQRADQANRLPDRAAR